MGFVARRSLLRAGDAVVRWPVVRWTWAGPAREEVVEGLGEFRPVDRESIVEMMAGRYLLASRFVDTQGVSPFSVVNEDPEWKLALRSFSWLRHFREARNPGERAFARTLTLDWIGREGRFRKPSWGVALTARRVLNWLRHLTLLVEDATPEQRRSIARTLGTQIRWLKLRSHLASDPVDQLLAAIALAAVAVSDERQSTELQARMRRLNRLLDVQIDDDGLHLTRSAKVQLQLLVELETLRQALLRDHDGLSRELGMLVESMHRGLDAISLSTGEPGYFNGTGQLPHDLVVAVQVQSASRFRSSGTAGGYGRLVGGRSIVVADSGLVPPLPYAAEAHAGALAFEFSRGAELVVGNCGPAPVELQHEAMLFRQGAAHSSLTIDDASAARLHRSGPLAGRLRQNRRDEFVQASENGESLLLRTHGFEGRFGVTAERRLTLLSDGNTLVGQDQLTLSRRRRKTAPLAVARFHLALGTTVQRSDEEDMLRLRLASGASWTFLWEHATLSIEESVRQSAHFGLHRIKQIVLETPLEAHHEIAWIFTRDED
jgi:uncharacterized heparinase superfamily protein